MPGGGPGAPAIRQAARRPCWTTRLPEGASITRGGTGASRSCALRRKLTAATSATCHARAQRTALISDLGQPVCAGAGVLVRVQARARAAGGDSVRSGCT